MNLGMADVLKKIKQTEREAARNLASAKEESVKIVSDARKIASEMITKASDDSVKSTQKTLDNAREEANTAAEKVFKEGAKDVAAITSSAEKNQSKAVDLILKNMSA